jgi:hypothetical protein
MSKELFWAGLIGITFGLIIAFGVWRVNSTLKPSSPTANGTPVPEKPVNEFKITLDKPAQNDVVTEANLIVSGITKPNTVITVSGAETDYATQTDTSGAFSQEVVLISGVNQIKVTAFDPEGNQSVEKILVVYSSAFELKSTEATPEPDATGDAEIRQKVQEKVQATLFKPKAYLGSVTDIAESTIQIKSSSGEIKQISTAEGEVAVINATGQTSKTVKLTDIAIGDFIVAMGYMNGNSVLKAQRILITLPVTDPQVEASYGKITEAALKTLTVQKIKTEDQEELTPDSSTDIYSVEAGESSIIKMSAIEEESQIMYVKSTEDDEETLRTLFIYPPAGTPETPTDL